jgi:3-deoxy-D-manno-octulosonic-acid transferase
VHIFFYILFLFLYHAAIRLAANWNPKAKRWIEGRKGLFKRLENELSQNKAPIVWLHCSSWENLNKVARLGKNPENLSITQNPA